VIDGTLIAVLGDAAVLDDALLGGTAGALIGATLSYRRQRRGSSVETAWLTVRWTWFGVLLAVLIHVLVELP
jgi:hypothetical protein